MQYCIRTAVALFCLTFSATASAVQFSGSKYVVPEAPLIFTTDNHLSGPNYMATTITLPMMSMATKNSGKLIIPSITDPAKQKPQAGWYFTRQENDFQRREAVEALHRSSPRGSFITPFERRDYALKWLAYVDEERVKLETASSILFRLEHYRLGDYDIDKQQFLLHMRPVKDMCQQITSRDYSSSSKPSPDEAVCLSIPNLTLNSSPFRILPMPLDAAESLSKIEPRTHNLQLYGECELKNFLQIKSNPVIEKREVATSYLVTQFGNCPITRLHFVHFTQHERISVASFEAIPSTVPTPAITGAQPFKKAGEFKKGQSVKAAPAKKQIIDIR